jgi:hypothetical protein
MKCNPYLRNLIMRTMTGRTGFLIRCFWRLLFDFDTPNRSNPRIFSSIHKRYGNTLALAPTNDRC